MRILAIADRPARRSIREIIRENNIDVIVTLGDLEGSEIFELEQITEIPKLGVYGNHCSGNYFDRLGIQNMHLSVFEYQGLRFGGFQGSVRYKESATAIMYTQEEATTLLEGFDHVDVMLAHCPPYGINDEPNELAHQGFYALRTYIENKQPAYFFHGHTYPNEQTLIKEYKSTEIIYIYQDQVVNITV